jgi:hypothetical protein
MPADQLGAPARADGRLTSSGARWSQFDRKRSQFAPLDGIPRPAREQMA